MDWERSQAPDDTKRSQRDCERTCAVTRTLHEPDELIRFVSDPQGTVVPDVGRRLPGRGVWIGCDRALVAEAVRRKVFARGLKREVTAPADLPERVEALLVRRAVDALALANKAGLVTAGFAKVETVIGRGDCRVLVHASDAAEDGAGRLDRRYAAVSAASGEDTRIVRCLSEAELGLAIGRSSVVHAALARGGAADNFLREVGRLQRYRCQPGAVACVLPSPGAKADE